MKVGIKTGIAVFLFSAVFCVGYLVVSNYSKDKLTDNDGYSVSEDGELLAYPVGATAVTIPDTVSGIEVVAISDDLFCGDGEIETVVVPDSVSDIGTGFKNCANLTGVNIGRGVSRLSYDMFEGDYKLSYISVSPDNPFYCSTDGCVYNASGSNMLILPAGKVAVSLSDDFERYDDSLLANDIFEISEIDASSKNTGEVELSLPEPLPGTAYAIFRSATQGGDYTPVVKLANGVNSYTDTNLISGETYYYTAMVCYPLDDDIITGDASPAVAVKVY